VFSDALLSDRTGLGVVKEVAVTVNPLVERSSCSVGVGARVGGVAVMVKDSGRPEDWHTDEQLPAVSSQFAG